MNDDPGLTHGLHWWKKLDVDSCTLEGREIVCRWVAQGWHQSLHPLNHFLMSSVTNVLSTVPSFNGCNRRNSNPATTAEIKIPQFLILNFTEIRRQSLPMDFIKTTTTIQNAYVSSNSITFSLTTPSHTCHGCPTTTTDGNVTKRLSCKVNTLPGA
ncbi:hypothetical protein EI94DRAFT_263150 [Lactarius quietus]|nr:hypothetical protein EI94DRAFT_263150 [Lactarius quietus]